jgi:pimeloyl-ACP methyl ester carboxylesterase
MIKATIQYLRNQGVDNFHLGGFSNGGFSISRLASTLREENGIKGLFFIDGISDGASIREAGFPVLIIQGAQDERVSAAAVRPIATALGDFGTYVELPGDHFIIMKQPKLVQDAITAWLEKQEADQ